MTARKALVFRSKPTEAHLTEEAPLLMSTNAILVTGAYVAPADSVAAPYRVVGTLWLVAGLVFSARCFVVFCHLSCDQLPNNCKHSE